MSLFLGEIYKDYNKNSSNSIVISSCDSYIIKCRYGFDLIYMCI